MFSTHENLPESWTPALALGNLVAAAALLLPFEQLLKPSKLLLKAELPILSCNPLRLDEVILRNMATALLVTKRHGPQAN